MAGSRPRGRGRCRARAGSPRTSSTARRARRSRRSGARRPAVARPKTTSMSCSVSTIVMPWRSLTAASRSVAALRSAGDMPAVGSSSMRMRGCSARLMASSRRFLSPCDSRRATSRAACPRARPPRASPSRPRGPPRWGAQAKGRAGPAPALRRCASTAMIMFSCVVRSENTRATWKDRPKPRRTRCQAGIAVTSRPSWTTRPASGNSSPLSTLNSVVLPAPFGPMMAKVSPRPTVRSTFFRTFTAGYDLNTPVACSNGPLMARVLSGPHVATAGSRPRGGLPAHRAPRRGGSRR